MYKVYCQGIPFHLSPSTIKKMGYFQSMMSFNSNRDKEIYTDFDPEIFRYVVELAKYGTLTRSVDHDTFLEIDRMCDYLLFSTNGFNVPIPEKIEVKISTAGGFNFKTNQSKFINYILKFLYPYFYDHPTMDMEYFIEKQYFDVEFEEIFNVLDRFEILFKLLSSFGADMGKFVEKVHLVNYPETIEVFAVFGDYPLRNKKLFSSSLEALKKDSTIYIEDRSQDFVEIYYNE